MNAYSEPLLGLALDAPIPTGSDTAPRQHKVPCDVVASGTSTFLVAQETSLPAGVTEATFVADVLATGHAKSLGLGGSHYQSNKVAIFREGAGAEYSFSYYQLAPGSRTVYANMECSNAASASALAAIARGRLCPTADGYVWATNVGTGQRMKLRTPHGPHSTDWGIEFECSGLWTTLREDTDRFEVAAGGRVVRGSVFRHGNVFVIADLTPQLATGEIIAALAGIGHAYASKHGLPPNPPKILCCRITARASTHIECSAACFSEGQRHRSLPGSAAMAVNAFYCVHGYFAPPPGEDSCEACIRFTHPSGTLDSAAQLRSADGGWEIVSTRFTTPARLLGQADVLIG